MEDCIDKYSGPPFIRACSLSVLAISVSGKNHIYFGNLFCFCCFRSPRPLLSTANSIIFQPKLFAVCQGELRQSLIVSESQQSEVKELVKEPDILFVLKTGGFMVFSLPSS